MPRVLVFVMGATAAGKTALALRLYQHFPFDIISVDSGMVYRGMDIGTAKPAKAVLSQTPHGLIDICDPVESYSAAKFRHDALELIEISFQKNRIPLLVGGTGLYFRALEQGLSILPEADSSVRKQIQIEAQQYGWKKLYEQLKELDPVAADRIHENDPQRIQRALEVYQISGLPMSILIEENKRNPLPFKAIKIVLSPHRDDLHQRVQQRFEHMLSAGIVEEARALFDRGDLHLDLPSMRMVGYRQLWQYFKGQVEFEEMKQAAVAVTRQLVKRQCTWLRTESNAMYYNVSDHDSTLDKMLQQIEQGIADADGLER